jgi:2-haloacid dehalogenase
MIDEIKIVLFDIDDTLYDYQGSIQKMADKAAFSVLGFEYLKGAIDKYGESKENLKSLYMKKQITHKQFYDRKTRYSILLNLLEIENKGLDAIMNDAFWRIVRENIKPFDNIGSLLSNLKEFYKLGTITNGLRWQQKLKLEHMNLVDYFNYLFISEDAGIEKPNKEFFEYILNKLNGIQGNECMVIGDNLIDDILGAKNLGMKTILYNPNFIDIHSENITPDYEINEISQIEEILL